MRVHFQVIEGERRRLQVFEGVVIKRQGAGVRETFTVRKQSFGVGVERTFPVHSPKIEKIERTAIGDVNRAKLYYLRGRVGKRARIREIRQDRSKVARRAGGRAGARAAGAGAVEPEEVDEPVAEAGRRDAGRGRGGDAGRGRRREVVAALRGPSPRRDPDRSRRGRRLASAPALLRAEHLRREPLHRARRGRPADRRARRVGLGSAGALPRAPRRRPLHVRRRDARRGRDQRRRGAGHLGAALGRRARARRDDARSRRAARRVRLDVAAVVVRDASPNCTDSSQVPAPPAALWSRPCAGRARSSSSSTAGSARASSPEPTRRDAARSPGRSSSPACCSTTRACASTVCGRSRT